VADRFGPKHHARVLVLGMATGSWDGSARLFEAEVDTLIQRALGVMSRPLNPGELRRYSLPPTCRHIEMWNKRELRLTR
jgi:hypothetical protein